MDPFLLFRLCFFLGPSFLRTWPDLNLIRKFFLLSAPLLGSPGTQGCLSICERQKVFMKINLWTNLTNLSYPSNLTELLFCKTVERRPQISRRLYWSSSCKPIFLVHVWLVQFINFDLSMLIITFLKSSERSLQISRRPF